MPLAAVRDTLASRHAGPQFRNWHLVPANCCAGYCPGPDGRAPTKAGCSRGQGKLSQGLRTQSACHCLRVPATDTACNRVAPEHKRSLPLQVPDLRTADDLAFTGRQQGC